MVYCKKVIKDSRQFWPAFVVISWSCRGVGVPAPTDRNKPCPRKAMQERGLESHAGKPRINSVTIVRLGLSIFFEKGLTHVTEI